MDPVISGIFSLIQTIFSAVLGMVVGILTAKINRHTDEVEKLEKRQKAGNDALKCLVRKSIIDLHDQHVNQGVPMTVERIHELTELHESYKILGGNGVIDKIYEELMNIPTTVIGKEDADETQ